MSTDTDPGLVAETQRFTRLVKHWCPANLHYEGFPNTLMRAFMQATACCADMQRKLDDKDPIRPLDSYPDPMQGFFNVAGGFIDYQVKDGTPAAFSLTVTVNDEPVEDASLFRSGLNRWMAIYRPGQQIERIVGAYAYYSAKKSWTYGHGSTDL